MQRLIAYEYPRVMFACRPCQHDLLSLKGLWRENRRQGELWICFSVIELDDTYSGNHTGEREKDIDNHNCALMQ
jgi:hypothetical protein